MANYRQSSPNKFLSFLTGGAARRQEQEDAFDDLHDQMEVWEDTKMKNPYAGVKNPYADMENVYEDQTVDLKAAQFQREQSQQNAANIIANLKGASGGSGVAGLAQVLANQGSKQAQQAAADIGRQEQANQTRALAEAGRIDKLEREGEQKADLMRREGERMVEQFGFDKQEKMLDFALRRKEAADIAIDNAAAQREQFISGAITGIGGAALSDIRVKENISQTGISPSGIPIYQFNYKGNDKTYSGTMAQDLIEIGREDAVTITDNGYYAVYYDMIDVNMEIKN